MKNKTYKFLIAFLIIILSAGSVPAQNTAATPSSYTVPTFTPAWTTGIISDNVGPGGIVVTDLDQNGKVDIAACSNGYAYVLNYVIDGTYNTTWYSQYIQCLSITSADRDSDSVSELYIATEDGQVLLFDGATYGLIDSFYLPTGTYPFDIAVGDVDDDSRLEIVIATSGATLVYDALNFNLNWQADGFGGDQIAISNLDDDAVNEIVVNGTVGHVLNAKLKTQEWAYTGGFGMSMDTGDVDSDGRDEIAFIADWENAYVLEGDTHNIRWQLTGLGDTNEVAVADTDKDGICEVLIGNGQWGSVTGYQGTDGDYLWAIPNPEHGVFGIGVGDTNNDSINEVVWGAGLSSSGKDALFVGSWIDQVVDWGSDDLDGPLYVAANDVDLDGQGEFVLASRSTTSGYEGGTIRVYDGLTHQVDWSAEVSDSYYDIYSLGIGQLDADPALEILVGGDNWYDSRLQSYDGLTHSVEWTSPVLVGGYPYTLELIDLDNDAVEEIVVALGQNLQVYHGASNIVQWDSGALDGPIQDFAVGDVDDDGIKDIAAMTNLSVYLFDSSTWAEKLQRTISGGELIAISEADANSDGHLVIVFSDDSSNHILQAWGGQTFPIRWQRSIGDVYLEDLVTADVDADGDRELVLMGSVGEYGSYQSVLWIGSHLYPFFWEYKHNGNWGTINSMALSDLDSDGQSEFLFGSDSLIQVDEISTSSIDVHRAMVPVINRACTPFFSDNFSNPNSGWPNEDAGTVLFAYENNEYRMLIRPTYYAAGARPGIQVSDYSASVDVRNQTGAMGSYGLVFGLSQDWYSFYTLEVYPDGWYGIYRYNGNSFTALAESYSPYINQGTATNKIKVDRNGTQIIAYANGHLLATLSDGNFMGNRYVGLVSFSYDQPNLDIRYDNFVIDQIKCGNLNISSTSADSWQLSPASNIFNFESSIKTGHSQP